LSWTRIVTHNITHVTTRIRYRSFVEYKFLLQNETVGKGQAAGSCECGKEPSGSIKRKEFLERLRIR